MNPEILGATFALSAAAVWGVSDFSGGYGARGMNPMRVVLFAHLAGLLCLVVLGFVFGESLPDTPYLLWGALSGFGAAFAFVCFYQALAIGQMGINAPIAAIVTSAMAVLFSAFQEGYPSQIQFIGFGLAMIAIWLMTVATGKTEGLGLAILGGIGMSVYLTCSKEATDSGSVFWPLAIGRAVSVISLLTVLALAGRTQKNSKLGHVIAAGVLDAVANALFALSANLCRLDVAIILSGLYPIGTVICAHFIIKERVSTRQAIGILVALASIPLISS